MSSRTRLLLFSVLAAGCLAAAAIAILVAVDDTSRPEPATASASRALPAARASGDPVVVYRDAAHGGQVAIAPLGRTVGPPVRTGMTCDRVHFAARSGICVRRGRGLAGRPKAVIFDENLRVRHAVALDGIPSRARVSPDGRLGSVTQFVTGHAYATPGAFSTETTIIDLVAGTKVADLESFTVLKGGRQVTAVDANYWGVTFAADGNTFYATLATGGTTSLIRGSVRSRTARAIHDNVECPSLSPDGRRIAYKRRTRSDARPWRLTVLDLATMRETPTAEMRSVDDQAEWSGSELLYGVDGAVWAVPSGGGGAPRRMIPGGDSPAAVT